MRAIALITVGTVVLHAPAFAASSNTSERAGAASARTIVPLILTHKNGSALRFSRFTSSSGGTVTVSPATGNVTATGGITFVPGQPSGTDDFTATGDPNRQIAIIGGSGTISSGPWTMAVTATPLQASSNLSATGTLNFSVGGTLVVQTNQPAGNYSGNYSVTVSYQ